MPELTDSHAADPLITLAPDKWVTLRDAFGVDSDMKVPAFSHRDAHVPEIDPPTASIPRRPRPSARASPTTAG